MLGGVQLATVIRWEQSFPDWFLVREAFLLASEIWPSIKLRDEK